MEKQAKSTIIHKKTTEKTKEIHQHSTKSTEESTIYSKIHKKHRKTTEINQHP